MPWRQAADTLDLLKNRYEMFLQGEKWPEYIRVSKPFLIWVFFALLPILFQFLNTTFWIYNTAYFARKYDTGPEKMPKLVSAHFVVKYNTGLQKMPKLVSQNAQMFIFNVWILAVPC